MIEWGLPIRTDLPEEVYALMDLYPQSTQHRPSIQYIPIPYRRDGEPRPKGAPPRLPPPRVLQLFLDLCGRMTVGAFSISLGAFRPFEDPLGSRNKKG